MSLGCSNEWSGMPSVCIFCLVKELNVSNFFADLFNSTEPLAPGPIALGVSVALGPVGPIPFLQQS